MQDGLSRVELEFNGEVAVIGGVFSNTEFELEGVVDSVERRILIFVYSNRIGQIIRIEIRDIVTPGELRCQVLEGNTLGLKDIGFRKSLQNCICIFFQNIKRKSLILNNELRVLYIDLQSVGLIQNEIIIKSYDELSVVFLIGGTGVGAEIRND